MFERFAGKRSRRDDGGMSASASKRVAIVGAGLSGLCCALRLQELGHTTIVCDACAARGRSRRHRTERRIPDRSRIPDPADGVSRNEAIPRLWALAPAAIPCRCSGLRRAAVRARAGSAAPSGRGDRRVALGHGRTARRSGGAAAGDLGGAATPRDGAAGRTLGRRDHRATHAARVRRRLPEKLLWRGLPRSLPRHRSRTVRVLPADVCGGTCRGPRGRHGGDPAATRRRHRAGILPAQQPCEGGRRRRRDLRGRLPRGRRCGGDRRGDGRVGTAPRNRARRGAMRARRESAVARHRDARLRHARHRRGAGHPASRRRGLRPGQPRLLHLVGRGELRPRAAWPLLCERRRRRRAAALRRGARFAFARADAAMVRRAAGRVVAVADDRPDPALRCLASIRRISRARVRSSARRGSSAAAITSPTDRSTARCEAAGSRRKRSRLASAAAPRWKVRSMPPMRSPNAERPPSPRPGRSRPAGTAPVLLGMLLLALMACRVRRPTCSTATFPRYRASSRRLPAGSIAATACWSRAGSSIAAGSRTPRDCCRARSASSPPPAGWSRIARSATARRWRPSPRAIAAATC